MRVIKPDIHTQNLSVAHYRHRTIYFGQVFFGNRTSKNLAVLAGRGGG